MRDVSYSIGGKLFRVVCGMHGVPGDQLLLTVADRPINPPSPRLSPQTTLGEHEVTFLLPVEALKVQ